MPGVSRQGASVQYEDTVGVDGDAGVSILGFRNDADAQLATADLSHTRLSTDEFGRLKTVAPSPITVGAYSDAEAADMHEPAVNTAAVITLAAAVGQRWYISGVIWSYDAAPTQGSLTIADGGAARRKIDITNAGPGFLHFDPPLRFTANSAVTATLAAAGAAVSGIVNWEGKFLI